MKGGCSTLMEHILFSISSAFHHQSTQVPKLISTFLLSFLQDQFLDHLLYQFQLTFCANLIQLGLWPFVGLLYGFPYMRQIIISWPFSALCPTRHRMERLFSSLSPFPLFVFISFRSACSVQGETFKNSQFLDFEMQNSCLPGK